MPFFAVWSSLLAPPFCFLPLSPFRFRLHSILRGSLACHLNSLQQHFPLPLGANVQPCLAIEGGKTYFEFFKFYTSCKYFVHAHEIPGPGHSEDDPVVHPVHISFLVPLLYLDFVGSDTSQR